MPQWDEFRGHAGAGGIESYLKFLTALPLLYSM